MSFNYIKIILIISFTASIFSCQSEKTTQNNKLEEITFRTDTSEGFRDISLKILSDKPTDSTHIYLAKGLYKGKTVGIQIEVKSDMPAGITKDGEISNTGFVKKPVTFFSIGKESNEFVKALSNLYAVDTSKPFTKRVTATTAFSLNKDIANLNTAGGYKFKLFFETETDVPEIYLNLNLQEGIIEISEKDQAYRKPIMNILTK
ncbi:hypothetical protein DBR43_15020 [Pedobacter sp. KBW06]|uniref:hypothetical protein n=1 Tax=Pedobacter sp. KBW06 TaxID=2153359 RepID=UPI000F5B7B39|nr:hypothetical protein [Pedobacter sp. KBW06]RQO69395.1 hypothetical protein DBR43_15020 [Pedobacter sp. KBW06]